MLIWATPKNLYLNDTIFQQEQLVELFAWIKKMAQYHEQIEIVE